ncbi:MAG: hypothetical protein OXC72_03845 [Roseovarius sp.]|nr:hypothetical protein [Roseovarius sp.]
MRTGADTDAACPVAGKTRSSGRSLPDSAENPTVRHIEEITEAGIETADALPIGTKRLTEAGIARENWL